MLELEKQYYIIPLYYLTIVILSQDQIQSKQKFQPHLFMGFRLTIIVLGVDCNYTIKSAISKKKFELYVYLLNKTLLNVNPLQNIDPLLHVAALPPTPPLQALRSKFCQILSNPT